MQSLAKSNESVVKSVAQLAQSEKMKKRFEDVLGKKAPQFLASVAGAVNVNPALQKCDPVSVMASAMVAATLDLEVVPSFGFAALVPYGNKAQFQIMTKGMVQLALRSGQFKAINVGKLYKDEILGFDPITGKFEINKNSQMRKSGKDSDVAGFFCYFALINGFEKTEFWTIEEIEQHGAKYSKNYNSSTSLWKTNFEAMAEKTVLKNTLAKYAPLSTQMRNAIVADQASFESVEKAESLEAEYIDSHQESNSNVEQVQEQKQAMQDVVKEPVITTKKTETKKKVVKPKPIVTEEREELQREVVEDNFEDNLENNFEDSIWEDNYR